jgi:hypothetical protein
MEAMALLKNFIRQFIQDFVSGLRPSGSGTMMMEKEWIQVNFKH